MNLFFRTILVINLIVIITPSTYSQTYKIVDTGQIIFYDNNDEIPFPIMGESFYGQDAHFNGNQPTYTDNGDGTITDNVTGLMWQKDPGDKLTYNEAVTQVSHFSIGGYDNWRLPSIKELYSLILFSGKDPSGWQGTDTNLLTPFIDTNYFDFEYGDTGSGERIIDAQFATSTMYVSTTMNGNATMFGVNFADGRIKGYGIGPMQGQTEDKKFFTLYVRGNPDYGVNDFINNGDGTISDNATGLMWTQTDNGQGVIWEDALDYVQQKNGEIYLGYNDWRLPNVKELQSIIDYTRAPAITNSAAIDPLFHCSGITDEGGNMNYPFYWSSTTHANMMKGNNATYIAFGEALGWMEMPPNSGNYQLLDVHGAGAQRSDPKTGDPADYPYGHGPQGDVIRIYNHVRLVRDDTSTTKIDSRQLNFNNLPNKFVLNQNYPNPFNPNTIISFSLPKDTQVILKIVNIHGEHIDTIIDNYFTAGNYEYTWDADNLPNGIYFSILKTESQIMTKKMIKAK